MKNAVNQYRAVNLTEFYHLIHSVTVGRNNENGGYSHLVEYVANFLSAETDATTTYRPQFNAACFRRLAFFFAAILSLFHLSSLHFFSFAFASELNIHERKNGDNSSAAETNLYLPRT